MDYKRLQALVKSPVWVYLEEYLQERRTSFMERLITDVSHEDAQVLRGRIRELDTLLGLPSKVSK